MRIGLDLRMISGGSGIARYISEISQAILTYEAESGLAGKDKNEYVLFFHTLTPELRLIYEKYGHKLVETQINHYSMAEQMRLPSILNKEQLDLIHFPHFNVPIFYNQPFVVTIHDLTHTKFPGKKKSHIFHRLAYNIILSVAVKKSRQIVAVSENTKKEILEFFGVRAEKISVVYEGVNKTYQLMDKDIALADVSNRFKISKPYILYVGVWRRYKNLPNLVRAFDLLKARGIDVQLVLAGEEDPFYPEVKAEILKSINKDDIIILGRVSDEELNLLYNASNLFVLPSQAEGFGLTALEAATCGIPIAASDIPTLREVLGQAAEFFDPNNVENMADVIASIVQNEFQGEELANLALKRAGLFSWKKAAKEMVNIFKSTK